MKKLYLFSAAMASLATSAIAADLPSRKEAVVPPPPPPMWTGFYAGLNIGGNVGTNSNTVSRSYGSGPVKADWIVDPSQPNLPPDLFLPLSAIGASQSGLFSNTQSGIIGGGQIGYNFQWKDRYLIGLEADIQGSGIAGTGHSYGLGSSAVAGTFRADGFVSSSPTIWRNNVSSSSNVFSNQTINSGVDWIGTVRGRLGYLVLPNLLIYGTGGLTYGGVHANTSNYTSNYLNNSADLVINSTPQVARSLSYLQPFFGKSSQSQVNVGWNAGAGVEWMLLQNWSVKLEAIYWNMGSMNLASYSYGPQMRACTTSACNGILGFTAGATSGNAQVNYQGIIARAGVNYHFNFDNSPIVAKF